MSADVVKQQKGSREYDNVMWNEDTSRLPSIGAIRVSTPQSTWACAPGVTSNRRCNPVNGRASPSASRILSLAPATYSFTR